MGSLIEELHRREAAAREQAEELLRRIERLNERLAQAEEQVRRLEITRETIAEISGPAHTSRPQRAAPAAPRGPDHLPIGVLTVPTWRPGLEVAALPAAYRDLMEVIADGAGELRAGAIAAACGLSTDKSKVEGTGSKLKRLTEHGWLTENEPGLFTPAHPNGGAKAAKPGETTGSSS